MNWLSKVRMNTIFHIMSQKRAKVEKKIDFWYSKVHISKRTQTENLQLLGFSETNKSVRAKPPKKCGSIFCRFWIVWTMRRFWYLIWLVVKVKWRCNSFIFPHFSCECASPLILFFLLTESGYSLNLLSSTEHKLIFPLYNCWFSNFPW